jgi:hypothetical protein
MATQLKPDYIDMQDVTTINLKENKFNGKIDFKYDNDSDDYLISETNALNKLCSKLTEPPRPFRSGKRTYYSCSIYVAGTLFSSQASTLQNVSSLTTGRKIRLVSFEKSSEVVDTKKAVDKLFAFPFAIAFDAITLPFQILFLAGQRK